MDSTLLEQNQTIEQFARLFPIKGSTSRSMADRRLLFWIAAEQTPPTPTYLASAMGITKAAITKLLIPLYADQLIAKEADINDSRSYHIILTELGEQAIEEMADDYFKPLQKLRKKLGKRKFNQLIALLTDANGVLMGD